MKPNVASVADSTNLSSNTAEEYCCNIRWNEITGGEEALELHQDEIADFHEIYKSMRRDKGPNCYDKNFEYKGLRAKLFDRIFDIGERIGMDLVTMHLAIKYFETILHFINFYQRNNRQQKLPSDPKPIKESVLKSSIYFGKDVSLTIKSLATSK